jgi:proline dehydrogenase
MKDSIIRSVGNFIFLRLFRRWVAGDKASDAIRCCRGLNRKGSACVINFLGEHYKESSKAEEAVAEYERLIDLIRSSGVRASITIKPSQFGFNAEDVDDPEGFCGERMLSVVEYATARGVMSWLDMEDSRYTGFTLGFYKRHAADTLLGVCLQANLKRTENDLASLIAMSKKAKVRIRLVKGIYRESPSISVTDEGKLHRRYLGLMRKAFEDSPAGFGIAVGTHHTEAITLARKLQKKHPKEFFEVEVLKGVLPSYYEKLRKEGLNVTEYVPYGPDAFAYSVRRARKNPGFARSILFAPFFDVYKKLYH